MGTYALGFVVVEAMTMGTYVFITDVMTEGTYALGFGVVAVTWSVECGVVLACRSCELIPHDQADYSVPFAPVGGSGKHIRVADQT